jgi:hypothetical protein
MSAALHESLPSHTMLQAQSSGHTIVVSKQAESPKHSMVQVLLVKSQASHAGGQPGPPGGVSFGAHRVPPVVEELVLDDEVDDVDAVVVLDSDVVLDPDVVLPDAEPSPVVLVPLADAEEPVLVPDSPASPVPPLSSPLADEVSVVKPSPGLSVPASLQVSPEPPAASTPSNAGFSSLHATR